MVNLHLVTVATSEKLYLPALKSSCSKYGHEIEVLGYGHPWRGLSTKFRLMLSYLSQLPRDDVVCFVDGHDVVCINSLEPLLHHYLMFETEHPDIKLVVGYNALETFHQKFVCKLKYGNWRVNSGTYIGRVRSIEDIIQSIMKYSEEEEDDQRLLIQYMTLHPGIVHIDTKEEFFVVRINAGEIVTIPDSIAPYFLHGPSYSNLNNYTDPMYQVPAETLRESYAARYQTEFHSVIRSLVPFVIVWLGIMVVTLLRNPLIFLFLLFISTVLSIVYVMA